VKTAVDAMPLALRTGGHIKAYIRNLVRAFGNPEPPVRGEIFLYLPPFLANGIREPPVHLPGGILRGSPRLWERFKLADAAYADQADVLFCPGATIPSWNLVPVAVSVPDASAFSPLPDGAPPWQRAQAKRLPFALARATRIFVPSEAIKKAVLEWNAGLPVAMERNRGGAARFLDRFRTPDTGTHRIPHLEARMTTIPWTAENAFRKLAPKSELKTFIDAYVGGEYVLAPCLEGYDPNLPLMLRAWFASVAKLRLKHRFVALVETVDRRFDRFMRFAGSLGVAERVKIAATDSLEATVRFHQAASLVLLPEDKPGCGLSLSRALACQSPIVSGGQAACLPDNPEEGLVRVSDLAVKTWHEAISSLLAKSGRRSPLADTPTWDDHAACIISTLANDLQKGDF
jgi:hypothetical protein